MDDAVVHFSRLLHRTAHAWRLAIDRRVRASGFGMSSWLAVAAIAGEAEPITQKTLAQLLGLEEASVVPLVQRLVKQDLVQRIQPDEDRRKRLLSVTEKGSALYSSVKAEADSLRAELLADIPPEQLAVTQQVLQRLLVKIGTV